MSRPYGSEIASFGRPNYYDDVNRRVGRRVLLRVYSYREAAAIRKVLRTLTAAVLADLAGGEHA